MSTNGITFGVLTSGADRTVEYKDAETLDAAPKAEETNSGPALKFGALTSGATNPIHSDAAAAAIQYLDLADGYVEEPEEDYTYLEDGDYDLEDDIEPEVDADQYAYEDFGYLLED